MANSDNNVNQKRGHAVAGPRPRTLCRFVVGSDRICEMYEHCTEFEQFFHVGLPNDWVTIAANSRWVVRRVNKALDARRQLHPEDTAILVLDIPVHDEADRDAANKFRVSIELVVRTLLDYVRNIVIVLQPGDETGARCFTELNRELRLALEPLGCHLTPNSSEEVEGAFNGVKWPARAESGAWRLSELRTYLRMALRNEAARVGYVRPSPSPPQGLNPRGGRSPVEVRSPKRARSRSPVAHHSGASGSSLGAHSGAHYSGHHLGASGSSARAHYSGAHHSGAEVMLSPVTEERLREELAKVRGEKERLRAEVMGLRQRLGKRSGAAAERRKLEKLVRNLIKKTIESISDDSSDSDDSEEEDKATGETAEGARSDGELSD